MGNLPKIKSILSYLISYLKKYMSNTMSKHEVYCSKTIHVHFMLFNFFKESRAKLISEVENNIDCPLIELILCHIFLFRVIFYTI